MPEDVTAVQEQQESDDLGSLTPEQIRELVAERQTLQNRIKTLNQESSSRRHQIKQLEERLDKLSGIDPDEYENLKKATVAKEDEELKSQERYQELLDRRRKEFEDQVKKIAAEKDDAFRQLEAMRRKMYVENAAVNAATKASAYDPSAVAKIISDSVELVKLDNGNYKAVIPNEYDPEDGSQLTIERKIEIMSKDRDNSWMFRPQQPQGVGGHGSSPAGQLIQSPTRTFKSAIEAAEFAKKNPDEWKRMVQTGEIQYAFKS